MNTLRYIQVTLEFLANVFIWKVFICCACILKYSISLYGREGALIGHMPNVVSYFLIFPPTLQILLLQTICKLFNDIELAFVSLLKWSGPHGTLTSSSCPYAKVRDVWCQRQHQKVICLIHLTTESSTRCRIICSANLSARGQLDC